MAKPQVIKRGKFLIASTTPLPYSNISYLIKKDISMLEDVSSKQYLLLTDGHTDATGSTKNIGEVHGLYIDPIISNGVESDSEAELYASKIVFFPKLLDSIEIGVYGFSLEFDVDFSQPEKEDGYLKITKDNVNCTTVALVKDPRHQVKDIDLTLLKCEEGRRFYDSIDKLNNSPILIVDKKNIYLQDSKNCDILYTKENQKTRNIFGFLKKDDINCNIDQVINIDKKGAIPVNKEEFIALLDERDKKLEKNISDCIVAVKDSIFETLKKEKSILKEDNTTDILKKNVVEKKKDTDPVKNNNIEDITFKLQMDTLLAENKNLKEANVTITRQLQEKEAVIQNMETASSETGKNSQTKSEESVTLNDGNDTSNKEDLVYKPIEDFLNFYKGK